MERVETTFKCNSYPGKRQPRLRAAAGRPQRQLPWILMLYSHPASFGRPYSFREKVP